MEKNVGYSQVNVAHTIIARATEEIKSQRKSQWVRPGTICRISLMVAETRGSRISLHVSKRKGERGRNRPAEHSSRTVGFSALVLDFWGWFSTRFDPLIPGQFLECVPTHMIIVTWSVGGVIYFPLRFYNSCQKSAGLYDRGQDQTSRNAGRAHFPGLEPAENSSRDRKRRAQARVTLHV